MPLMKALVVQTAVRTDEIPLTILQAAVHLYLVLIAVDPEPPALVKSLTGRAAVPALVQAHTGRAAVPALAKSPTGRVAVLALVQAPAAVLVLVKPLAGRAALLAVCHEFTRRAQLLRAELLGPQVVCSHASRVASRAEVIAALMLGGSWHVATDLKRHGLSWLGRGSWHVATDL